MKCENITSRGSQAPVKKKEGNSSTLVWSTCLTCTNCATYSAKIHLRTEHYIPLRITLCILQVESSETAGVGTHRCYEAFTGVCAGLILSNHMFVLNKLEDYMVW